MPVTSLEFFLFVALLCLALFTLGTAERWKKLLLIGASLLFYATYDVRFPIILLFLTALSYGVGLRIVSAESPDARKRWLWVGVVLGLLPLCTFKYLPAILGGDGGTGESPVGLGGALDALVLPIGISFYTFQALSYPLDLYRGTLKRPASLLDLTCFITFFPKLLLGPIARAGDFLPQLARPIRVADDQRAASALWLIMQGLAKKLILADILAQQFVDPAFGNPSSYGTLFLVLGVFAYSFQLYLDLSGYTDIARGAARFMGFELAENFNRPYLAATISNFWQRWHISMSSFFRDYLYFALGGSKAGNVYVNLLITFVAIGIWHGAGWNFALYGLIHGALVGWERYRRGVRRSKGLADSGGFALIPAIVSTFLIVCWARLLFRAESVDHTLQYLRALQNVGELSVPVSDLGLLVLALSFALHFTPPRWATALKEGFVGLPSVFQAVIVGGGLFFFIALPEATAGFIYAQF